MTSSAGRRIPAEWVSSRPRAVRARHVADQLRERIIAGEFADDPLPDESTLVAQLDASRNTVREALGLLRDEGLVKRQRGVGTTVMTPKYGHGLDQLTGLAEALAGYGPVSNEVRVAEFVADAPAVVAERLGLSADAGAVHIERLRRLDGIPLSLDITYLAGDVGRRVLQGDLAGRDLFALIEEASGRRLGRAEIAVHAANADPETAELLEIPAGAALFEIERLTYLSDGRPVDAETLRIRADRLSLHATLHRRPAAHA